MSNIIARIASEAEKALAQRFKDTGTLLPGNRVTENARKHAFGAFAEKGLPSRRVEAWHYTDLRAAMRSSFPPPSIPDAQAKEAARQALAGLKECGNLFVLLDGVYVPELGAIAPGAEFTVRGLDEALGEADDELVRDLIAGVSGSEDSALSLNAAFMSGGVIIDINEDANLGLPLNIVSLTSRQKDASVFSRSLVRAGAGAQGTVVERHISLGAAGLQNNSVLALSVAAGAQVSHVWASDGPGAGQLHVNSLLASLGENSRFSSFALLDSGEFLRRQIFVRFDGSGAELSLSGLSLIRNKDHVDTTLVVEHVHPDCNSAEYFKQIVDGSGTGVFQGKISVAPEAQKTDGAMKSQTILLSDDAAMYNKPELEIFADDVACGHGATCGALDQDQLFYAMSRGLARKEAEALLLEAFGADAIEHVANETLKEELVERLRTWLAGRDA